MNRRGLTLLEMLLAIGITAVVVAAIATMMAAATNSLISKDDGRRSAIRLATTQIRLGAYIAPSRCFLESSSSNIVLWFDDSRESNTVHISEVRWIDYDDAIGSIVVRFVDFPSGWSQALIDAADIQCNSMTDYETLLATLEVNDLVKSIQLVDSVASCTFWLNAFEPTDATRVSIRFSFDTVFDVTKDAMIDETIRVHQDPAEE